MIESHLEYYRRWHRLARPYFKWQFRQFEPYLGRRVADIGCGLGNLTSFMSGRELYIGVDPDFELLGELQRTFGDMRNIETFAGDIVDAECREFLIGRHPDSILCVNVLEHIEDDKKALENMVAALPNGGTLCLLVAAMPCIFGTLDLLDNHVRRYTPPELEGKLKLLPVEIVKLYYFNAVGAVGWWLKGRVLKQKRQSNSDYRIMNFLIPVASRLEAAMKPPFGLSLVAVARRKK